MSIEFTIKPLKEKPKKINTRKERSSKYQPIIDEFLKSGHELVMIDGTGKKANSLAMILERLIKKREDSVKVSVRNEKVFLEK